MKTDANVVHLSKVVPEQSPTSPVGRLPVALTNVRDKAAQQLKMALQALFDVGHFYIGHVIGFLSRST